MYKTMLILATAILVGCETSLLNPGTRGDGKEMTDENPENTSDQVKDVAIVFGTQEAGYIGTSSLAKGVEDGSDFFQHDRCMPIVWGKWFFAMEGFTSGNIYKYTMDENNNLTGPDRLEFGNGSGANHLAFASETKAYVSLANLGKIAVINPSTMTKTGEIDLSDYAAGGDGNPDPTTSIIRGNYLFVALSQLVSMMVAHDTAGCVAVIDIREDTLVKVISDERIESLGNIEDANGNVFMDENENIYFNSTGVWGYQEEINEGFLRINSGETEFDPSYSFSLTATSVSGVPGNTVVCALRMAYMGGTTMYSSLLVPGLMSGEADYMNDRAMQPVAIDMVEKTITKLDIPVTTTWLGNAFCVEESGTVLFAQNEGDDTPAGIYRYDPSTGALDSSPVLKIDENVYFIRKLEE